MSFLSVQNNTYLKSHNNNSFILESPARNNFVNDKRQTPITENNNQVPANGQEKSLQEVWSKHKFEMDKVKVEPMVSFDNVKTTWAEEKIPESAEDKVESPTKEIEERTFKTEQVEVQVQDKDESPSHHARRPPNAFLIFCKKHRPIVRERYPNLENRGVTKILGEWWALLHGGEKMPYSDLAKEYKDAFLSANPNFRWYKLPAPPLRTLTPRPTTTVAKIAPPLSSPSHNHLSEFTPGKLADESQLGGLTSLMNNNFTTTTPKTECCTIETALDNNNHKTNDGSYHKMNEDDDVCKTNDNVGKYRLDYVSPVSHIQANTPPKPLKKRFFDYNSQSRGCARNILPESKEDGDGGFGDQNESSNLTQQDLMNKVVDGIFAKKQSDDHSDRNGSKETRKSERMCKGKRYEMFMVEGRLLGNKRDKLVQQKQSRIESKIETELNALNNNTKPETPKLDLGNTIKRLAERTNVKLDFENQNEDNTNTINQRARSISETSEGSNKSSPPNFNLDLRISNLPCLSYDEFLLRKRESKKRKIRIKTDGESKHKVQKLDSRADGHLVGSKKRKNKQSITHLGQKEVGLSSELLGLATLAEVAANTEKINEQISE